MDRPTRTRDNASEKDEEEAAKEAGLQNDEEEEEFSTSSSSSSSEGEGDGDATESRHAAKPSKTHVGYFNAQAATAKGKAQKRRRKKEAKPLSELDLPSLPTGQRICKLHLDNTRRHHSGQLSALMEKHCESFPRLDHYVQNGFNILFYGLGSKKKVIERFGLYLSRKAGEMPAVLVVHGYSPCFSLRQLIESIGEQYFGLKSFPVGIKSSLTKCRYLVELSKAVATTVIDTQVEESAPATNESTPAYSQPRFNYIWDALRSEGWQHFPGVGLSSYYYAMPNVTRKAEGTLGEDMFRSELEVYAFCAANRKDIFEEATRYANAQQRTRRTFREESSSAAKKEPIYFTRPLYMLFHSIDGETARTQEVQMALSMLAESPRIHFIASVDHMNAPLVWNNQQADRFNWLWIEAVTFEPLFSETRDTEAISTTKQARAAVGTSYVLKSLTPNHLRVLQELAKYQLKQKEDKEMEFSLLLERCTAEMYVNNENGLRTLLVEMTDHELVKSRRDSNDVEKLRICLTDAEIKTEILKAS